MLLSAFPARLMSLIEDSKYRRSGTAVKTSMNSRSQAVPVLSGVKRSD